MDHRNLMRAKSSFVLHFADSLDGSSFGLHSTDNKAISAHLSDILAAEYRLHPPLHKLKLFAYDLLPPFVCLSEERGRERKMSLHAWKVHFCKIAMWRDSRMNKILRK